MEIKQNLEESVNRLKENTKELFDFLDSISNEIHKIEAVLRELKIFFEFEYKIDDDTSLNWCEDPQSKQFRVVYKDEFIQKAFSECKLPIRLKNAKYLNQFVNELNKIINDKKEEFKKMLESNK